MKEALQAAAPRGIQLDLTSRAERAAQWLDRNVYGRVLGEDFMNAHDPIRGDDGPRRDRDFWS
jgi:hypothetical protein